MPRENLRSLTPVTKQLLADTLRIDAVLDSFVVPPANVVAAAAPSSEVPQPNQTTSDSEGRKTAAERQKQNLARRTRRS